MARISISATNSELYRICRGNLNALVRPKADMAVRGLAFSGAELGAAVAKDSMLNEDWVMVVMREGGR